MKTVKEAFEKAPGSVEFWSHVYFMATDYGLAISQAAMDAVSLVATREPSPAPEFALLSKEDAKKIAEATANCLRSSESKYVRSWWEAVSE